MTEYAEVPLGYGEWVEGKVIEYDEEKGLITIQADDGTKYKGCESQALFFTKTKPD